MRVDSAPVFAASPPDAPASARLWIGPAGDQARPPGAEPSPASTLGSLGSPGTVLPSEDSEGASSIAPGQKWVRSFPTSKTLRPAPDSRGGDWAGSGEREPPWSLLCAGPGRLEPRCPWAARAAGLSAVSICSGPVLPPSPGRLSHLPRLPGRFFRWKPALPRPTLIKAWRKGREFLLGSSYTCSALSPWPGLAGGRVGAQPMPSLAAPPPLTRQAGAMGAPAGGDCPLACD